MKTCKQSISRPSRPFIPKRRTADSAKDLTQVYCVVLRRRRAETGKGFFLMLNKQVHFNSKHLRANKLLNRGYRMLLA